MHQTESWKQNIISDNSSLHQHYIQMKRILYALSRDINNDLKYKSKLQLSNASPDILELIESDINSNILIRNEYKLFILWLYSYSQYSIFPTASFVRSSDALDTIHTIIRLNHSPIDKHLKFSFEDLPQFPQFITQRLSKSLYHFIIHGDYLPDRLKAFSIYSQLNINFIDLDYKESLKNALFLLNDIHPNYVESGILLCKLLYFQNSKNSAIDQSFHLLNDLLNTLKLHISHAENNLLFSAKFYPIYSYFGALDGIFETLDFKKQQSSQLDSWKTFIITTLEYSKQASKLVLDICADESPEGKLPTSYKDMQSKMNQAMNLETNSGNYESDYNSQLILHQCFRTIKDSTSVLATILEKFPLPKIIMDDKSPISYEWIIQVGDLLLTLLVCVRHRGAFSALSLNFERCVTILLSSKIDILIDIPKQWLEKLMIQITQAGASITRRSAGLPMAILSVVGKSSIGRKMMLDITMNRLMEIARLPVNETKDTLDLPQVHAINVIKTILHDAQVSEDSKRFMTDAFYICINGFSSLYFPIRNCSVMLFTTLMNKILGAHHCQETDEKLASSKITSKAFFGKFPAVYNLLLAGLESAAEDLENGIVHPVLYPILSIISRLKYYDETDTMVSMLPFKPLVMKCLTCKIFKVREMAARSYLSLICPDKILDALLPIFDHIIELKDYNQIHGTLLLIQFSLKRNNESHSSSPNLLRQLSSKLRHMIFLMNSKCNIISSLYLDIVSGFLFEENLNDSEIESDRFEIWQTVKKFEKFEICSLLDHVLLKSVAQIILKGSMFNYSNSEMEHDWSRTFLLYLNHPSYEVQLVTLKLMRETSVASKLNLSSIKSFLLKLIIKPESFHLVIRESAELFNYLSDTCDTFEIKFTPFIDSIQNLIQSQNMVTFLLPLYATMISHEQNEPQNLKECSTEFFLKQIDKWNHESMPLNIRISIVQAIKQSKMLQPCEPCFMSMDILILLIHLYELLEDEDYEIRESCASICQSYFALPNSLDPSTARTQLFYKFQDIIIKPNYNNETDIISLQTYITNHMMKSINITIKSVEYLIENDMKSSKILFNVELDNPKREAFKDLLFSYWCLQKSRIHIYGNDRNIRTRCISEVINCLKLLLATTNLSWWSGRASVFSAISKLIVNALLILEQSNLVLQNDDETLQIQNLLQKMETIDLHPFLLDLIKNPGNFTSVFLNTL